MKRCPECRRDYYDDTLLYCLDDGNALLEGPSSGSSGSDEPQTAILHTTDVGGYPPTRAQIQTSEPTAVLPSAGVPAKGRSRVPLVISAIVMLLAVGAAAWYLIPRKPVRPGQNMEMSKLVSGLKGVPGDVSISPDGKYVAYSLTEDGKSSLWLRQLSQDASIPVVPASDQVYYYGISFSPDNELIYFSSATRGQRFSIIYSVPVVGGKEPKKVRENVVGPTDFSLSPDGTEIAFQREYPETGEWAAFVVKTDGSGDERKVLSRIGDDWFDSIAWSPDGEFIAFGFATVKGGYSTWIELAPSRGGEPVRLGNHKFGNQIKSLTWLHDGSGLVATTAMSASVKNAVWHIAYPDGAVERVTKELNAYFAVDVTADGKTAVMGYGDFDLSIWVSGRDEVGKKVADGNDIGQGGVAYLNDGRIIYTTNEKGEDNLTIMNADGSGARPLTTGKTSAIISPSVVSPDGNTIVFTSTRSNLRQVWRVNDDGTGLEQLTTIEADGPMFSRDGKWIVFDEMSPSRRLMKMPAAGGEPTPVASSKLVWHAAGFSEDGKLVACTTSDNNKIRTALIELETGNFAGLVDMPPTAGLANFSRNGKDYIYVDVREGLANLWAKPVAGGPARQLTKFTDGFLKSFADAPDGKSYVITRSHGTNEIVIARNFR